MKEYGKLTTEQFRAVIGQLPEVRRQSADLQTLVRTIPKERSSKVLVEGFNPPDLYELDFPEHLAVVLLCLGAQRWLKGIARSDDPQQQMIEDMQRQGFGEEFKPLCAPGAIAGLVFTLQRTLLSVFLYKRTTSSLVAEVREGDSTDTLFQAVRVDRSAVAAPTIARQIALAEMRKDETFFLHLRSALKGPQKKHWAAYQDLRYAFTSSRSATKALASSRSRSSTGRT